MQLQWLNNIFVINYELLRRFREKFKKFKLIKNHRKYLYSIAEERFNLRKQI